MQALLFASMALAQNQGKITVTQKVGANSAAFLSTQSQAFNGNSLWRNALPEAQVWNLPEFYQDTFQTTTPADYRLSQGSLVTYECPAGGTGPCDVVVFLYECYPCESKKGGLPAHLTQNEGYARSRCAPTFTIKKGGPHHKTTAFVKTIPAGHVEQLEMPGDVEFVFFGMSDSGEGRDCPALNELQCKNTKGQCKYHQLSGQCSVATCTQKGPGGCNRATCAYNDL